MKAELAMLKEFVKAEDLLEKRLEEDIMDIQNDIVSFEDNIF